MDTANASHDTAQEDAQRLAVETTDRSVVVSAGAGSGKTQVLAERFVHLVKTGKSGVDEILTITYTRKAAREMKERIAQLLEREGMSEARWVLESAYISTIDSLCARLLRENPFECQVDPFFEQLAEHNTERWFARAFERVVDLHSTQTESDVGRLLREAYGRMRFGSDPRDALHTLRQDLYRAIDTVRLFGWTRDNLLQWVDNIEQSPDEVGWQVLRLMRQALSRTLSAALDLLLRQQVPSTGNSLAAELRRIQQALSNTPLTGNPAEVATEIRKALVIRHVQEHVNHPVLTECLERLREWLEVMNPTGIEQEVQQAWRTAAVLRLMVAAWDEYQQVKRDANSCDFADVMSEAIRLLREHPTVLERYRQRFKYVMVDEFQDANHLQMQLISLLSHPNNLFVVGDAQQSIYAFRHAEVKLFRNMERQARKSPEQALLVDLKRNFRSRPEILCFVGNVYSAVWSPSVGGDVFRPLHSARRFAPKKQPSVEFVLTPAAISEAMWLSIANATAKHIQQLVQEQRVKVTAHGSEQGQPIRYRHIAILLRQTSQVAMLEEALSRAGVPFYNTARRNYYIRPEVRDLISALTVVDSPMDDVAVAAALRSPLVGVSIDTLYACAQKARELGKEIPLWLGVRRWLESGADGQEYSAVRQFTSLIERLQTRRAELNVAQVLSTLVAEMRYETRLLCRPEGKQRVANVRKLLQMATDNHQMPIAAFVDMVNELERIALREGEAPVLEEVADVVRIYTIHGAKGLQFPVVYLPDVARPVNRRPQTRLITCIPAQRFIAQGFVEDSPLPPAAETWARQHEREEELRVWYVAMTRAIEHLVFVAPNGGGRLWWNLFLDALQLPHSYDEDTILTIAEGCSVQVYVTDDQAYNRAGLQDEERLKRLAEWLQGSSHCSVEELIEWLST